MAREKEYARFKLEEEAEDERRGLRVPREPSRLSQGVRRNRVLPRGRRALEEMYADRRRVWQALTRALGRSSPGQREPL